MTQQIQNGKSIFHLPTLQETRRNLSHDEFTSMLLGMFIKSRVKWMVPTYVSNDLSSIIKAELPSVTWWLIRYIAVPPNNKMTAQENTV